MHQEHGKSWNLQLSPVYVVYDMLTVHCSQVGGSGTGRLRSRSRASLQCVCVTSPLTCGLAVTAFAVRRFEISQRREW